MVSTNDFRNGTAFVLDGAVHVVLEAEHVKQARGSAFVRAKIRNVETGSVVSRTFRAGERLPKARIDTRPMQYLYSADGQYHFMDTETYDQISLAADVLGDGVHFLKENTVVDIAMVDDRVIGAQLPTSVELEVVETAPGVRGDTVSGGSKPAKLETGAVVQVPLFIEQGEVIRVDTRTGEYIERV